MNNSLEHVIEFSEEVCTLLGMFSFYLIKNMQFKILSYLQNADKIFGSKIHNHILLFMNSTEESHVQILNTFRGGAQDFKGKVKSNYWQLM